MFLNLLQVSASFYDEIRGAMHSVEHGFGKLLSDVVIDVTDTVHCTISAVEHVLTLNGLMKNKSPYSHKCQDGPIPSIDRHKDDPLENFLKERDAIEGKRVLSNEIHQSISKVNSTLRWALDHHNGQQKIQSISKVLKDETEQLTKVSNMLRNELHNIKRNLNTQLQKFDTDITPSVWSELDKKKSNFERLIEAKPGQESRKHVNNPTSLTASNEPDLFTDAKREFHYVRDDEGQNSEPVDFPKTFRGVAEREKSKLINHNSDDKSDPKSIFSADKSAFDQFSPFYDPDSKGLDEHQRIIEDALSVIRDSHRTDQIMDELNKSKSTDVFNTGKNVINF